MKTSFIRILVILLLLLPLADCQINTNPITVGEEVEVATETIGPEGGTITVSKPGDPLDGFTIEVPEGAYQEEKTFKISYRPIERHQLGEKFNPITPLIYVDNGGDIAEDFMTVTLPANIPEGYFAMGYYYDEETGQLNALPLLDEDSTSLTIMTTHFTGIGATAANEDGLLEDPVDTGFKHGVDDWPFANQGSYVARGGHCSGQCMAAMYYYDQNWTRDEHGRYYPDLYPLYDNDGNPDFKTPDFPWDDELAYKLCSMIHKKQNWDNSMTAFLRNEQRKSDDKRTLALFAYSLAIELNRDTRSPQHMSIGRILNQGTPQKTWEGHVLIIFKKSGEITLPDGRKVYILYASDPNQPWNKVKDKDADPDNDTVKKIIYDIATEKFDPWYFGNDDQGNRIMFDDVAYYDKYCLMKKEGVAALWAKVEDKSIGVGDFPEYSLTVVEADTEMSLYDGFKTSSGSITIKLCDISKEPFLFQQQLVLHKATITNKIGTVQEIGTYNLASDDDDCLRVSIQLQEGENIIGFLVNDKYIDDPINAPNKIDWNYVGFDWFHIIREKGGPLSDITGGSVSATVESTCQNFVGQPPSDYITWIWFYEGSFSGNRFWITWDTDHPLQWAGDHSTGKIDVILDIDPNTNEVKGVKTFTAEETLTNDWGGYGVHVTTTKISGQNVPLTEDFYSPDRHFVHFRLEGEQACSSISSIEWEKKRIDPDSGEETVIETCSGAMCLDNEGDPYYIDIGFSS